MRAREELERAREELARELEREIEKAALYILLVSVSLKQSCHLIG